ncbi:phosphoserine phosphatase-like [Daphnia pulex]|uniref:phosphoserine phosphatase-like n=1 Tax=Daphnia pulex TaxID=6669 RepID=UPI001EDD60BB|nr:phosphoserine phosphatase-like [Daphnia pulex]XP_046652716.1 phosphoserine phosphatase-like [Daphnia pulicaria]
MSTKQAVITLLKQADAVCFDVDSTVCIGEGIDDLALCCGKGQQVKEMTSKAMSGNVDFREALKLRLNLIQPHYDQVVQIAKEQHLKITPHLETLIKTLHVLNKKPYLISGGFESLIQPVADHLGIPKENIYANKLKFYHDGTYAGFDEDQPTSRSGGKSKVIQTIREKFGHSIIVMIGDGITDLEACPPADAFIGYGGNVAREVVKANAAWFVTDFQDLINVLTD